MKMAADMIENYENHPAFQFIMDVPTVWDETKVINAKIGNYITIARRSNDKWFVGSLADENAYQLNIPLSFLDKNTLYEATIYGDALNTDWENNPEAYEISKWKVRAIDTIVAALSKAGGKAISIIPIKNETGITLQRIQQYNKLANARLKAFEALNTFGNWHKTHLALNKPVSLTHAYHERFPASGKNALTDGERGRFNFSAGGWQGFYGNDLEATVDLSSLTEIKSISVGFLHSPNDWIFHPVKVSIFVSDNGTDFIKLAEKEWKLKKPEELTRVEIKEMSHTFKPMQTRYVKIVAKSILKCPDWHYGKNQNAWLFCDEIVIE
jgi:LysM repeat protein